MLNSQEHTVGSSLHQEKKWNQTLASWVKSVRDISIHHIVSVLVAIMYTTIYRYSEAASFIHVEIHLVELPLGKLSLLL